MPQDLRRKQRKTSNPIQTHVSVRIAIPVVIILRHDIESANTHYQVVKLNVKSSRDVI